MRNPTNDPPIQALVPFLKPGLQPCADIAPSPTPFFLSGWTDPPSCEVTVVILHSSMRFQSFFSLQAPPPAFFPKPQRDRHRNRSLPFSHHVNSRPLLFTFPSLGNPFEGRRFFSLSLSTALSTTGEWFAGSFFFAFPAQSPSLSLVFFIRFPWNWKRFSTCPPPPPPCPKPEACRPPQAYSGHCSLHLTLCCCFFPEHDAGPFFPGLCLRSPNAPSRVVMSIPSSGRGWPVNRPAPKNPSNSAPHCWVHGCSRPFSLLSVRPPWIFPLQITHMNFLLSPSFREMIVRFLKVKDDFPVSRPHSVAVSLPLGFLSLPIFPTFLVSIPQVDGGDKYEVLAPPFLSFPISFHTPNVSQDCRFAIGSDVRFYFSYFSAFYGPPLFFSCPPVEESPPLIRES